MARPKNEHEPVLIRFVPGTKERVRSVLTRARITPRSSGAPVDKEIARRLRPIANLSPPPMPEDRLDPYVALDVIRAFAKVALTNEEPTLHANDSPQRDRMHMRSGYAESPNPQPNGQGKGRGEGRVAGIPRVCRPLCGGVHFYVRWAEMSVSEMHQLNRLMVGRQDSNLGMAVPKDIALVI